MSDAAYDDARREELSFSDLESFGRFLALGQFDESNVRSQIRTCGPWLVAKHAEVWRWMRDAPALWPPMHKELDKLRKDLHRQNAEIHGLYAGPHSFLMAAKIELPGAEEAEEPNLFENYRKNVRHLFNTLLRFDSLAKLFDKAYEQADFTEVSYDHPDLDKYRDELSERLETLGKTLELMAEVFQDKD